MVDIRTRIRGRTRPIGAVSFSVTRGGITTPVNPPTLWQRLAALIRRFAWR